MVLGLYAKEFSEWIRDERGGGNRELAELKSRSERVKRMLEPDRLNSLTEEDLASALSQVELLSAEEGKRLAEGLCQELGLDAVRETLKYVLYSDDTVENRFKEALERLYVLPPEALMELLLLAKPTDFCLWGKQAKDALRLTGQSGLYGLGPQAFGDALDEAIYIRAWVALSHVKETLSAYLGRKADFLDVHAFCRYVTYRLRDVMA